MSLLEVRCLSASYDYPVLQEIDLSINAGEIVGLCGPNNAGKSTFCKCLAGTKALDQGKIIFDGWRINDLTVSQRLSLGLSLCPERSGESSEQRHDPQPIYREQTVWENLELLRNLPSEEWWANIKLMTDYFPFLKEFLDFDQPMKKKRIFSSFFASRAREKQKAGKLSGGESQMLGIVRKIVPLLKRGSGSRLLIVDEPTRGLAPNRIAEVFDALQKVRADFGISVLLIEEMLHKLSAVDRAYVMQRGRIVGEGHVSELMLNSAVAAAFTGREQLENFRP